MEHRLSFVSGVGDGGALLGPEGAGHGVSSDRSLVGRELRPGAFGFLDDWHDSPFIKLPALGVVCVVSLRVVCVRCL